MKQALRQGTYATLNIYSQTGLAGSILGKRTPPSSVGVGVGVSVGSGGGEGLITASVYVNDGCNVQTGTMSNGAVAGYNEGKTAAHETGHWLGLLRVFERRSCGGEGDFIADTPQQSSSTQG